jgi:uncharacterized protein (DUF1778 family)
MQQNRERTEFLLREAARIQKAALENQEACRASGKKVALSLEELMSTCENHHTMLRLAQGLNGLLDALDKV